MGGWYSITPGSMGIDIFGTGMRHVSLAPARVVS